MTALDGKATVDATFGRLEALILAHRAVESIARVAGTALGEAHGHASPPPAYVIAQPGDAQALLAYRVFRLQVHELSEAYQALTTAPSPTLPSPPAPAAPHEMTRGIDSPAPPTSARAEIATRFSAAAAALAGVASGITPTLIGATLAVQAAASLVSYLRTETTFTGQDVAVDEAMFVSELRAHLRPAVRLYYPGLLPIGLVDRAQPDDASTDDHGATASDLVGDPIERVTRALLALRTQEARARDALDHGAPNADARAQFAAFQAQQARLEASVLGVAAAIPAAGADQQVDDHSSGDDAPREQPPESSPPAPHTASPGAPPPDMGALATLLHGAALDHLLQEQALLLVVRIQRAGGSTRIERNLLWWRSRLSASGGAVITLLAFDGTGAVRLARTLSASTGYRTLPTRTAAATAFDVGHWTPHEPPPAPRARWWEFWAWWDDA